MGKKDFPSNEADTIARKRAADSLLHKLAELDPEAAKVIALMKEGRIAEKEPETLQEHIRFVLDPELKTLWDKEVPTAYAEMQTFLQLQLVRNSNRTLNNPR